MKAFEVISLLLATSLSVYSAAVSTQYQFHDGLGGYSYGYADPNSQKHELKSHGVVHGGYSYVDGHGKIQSVKYTADPIHGFEATGTNFPTAHVVHGYAPLSPYDGTVIDTPEVEAAKVYHFAAHAEAKSRHTIHKRAIWENAEQRFQAAPAPVNGVPVDTPEVAKAKAEHLAIYSRVLTRYSNNGPLSQLHVSTNNYYPEPAFNKNRAPAPSTNNYYADPVYNNHHAPIPSTNNFNTAPNVAQYTKSAYYPESQYKSVVQNGDSNRSQHKQHVPVIQNGVPVETPEVQLAKATHFAAVAAAQAYAKSKNQNNQNHQNNENQTY